MAKSNPVPDEIESMRQVAAALDPLDSDQRGRVLRWAIERFGTGPTKSTNEVEGAKLGSVKQGEKQLEVGEFFAQAAPATDMERALVMSYWVQENSEHGEEFDASTVNTQLKQLGHGVSNITRALDKLKAQKPQPIIQKQKSGKTKQARKVYKVTDAGKASVQKMISTNNQV